MSFWPSIISWLKQNRTSARMAFILRMIAMAAGSVFGLLWTRLLLHALGDPLMGLFRNFQALTRLGGLGDFGITSALFLIVGKMLGRKDDAGLRSLMASARTLFLFLACGLCVLFIGLSPWLPKWLNFTTVPGAGSMGRLFIYGGMSLWLMIIGGYFASLNYAHGTVTWPILPSVILSQIFAPFCHWRLALLHLPLWVQMLPYLVAGILMAVLSWLMLKWTHPWLGDLTPLKRERAHWKTLAGASWWAYLVSLGTAVYVATDQLVIGAVIGTGVIQTYLGNYKVCELGITLIVTAAFVGFPKITQWVSSPDPEDRKRLLAGLHRLSVFEIVMACGVVLGYIAFNNLFIRYWLDSARDPLAHRAPLWLQFAFAANLAVSVGGNAGIQFSMRAGDNGLKYGGLAVAGTGLLNLVLSIVSAKLAPVYGVNFAIIGVAVATVIAQSISSLILGTVTCRYLGLSVTRWAARCWLLPIVFTFVAAVVKSRFPENSFSHLGIVSGCYVILFLIVCWLAGVNRELLRTEFTQVRRIFGST